MVKAWGQRKCIMSNWGCLGISDMNVQFRTQSIAILIAILINGVYFSVIFLKQIMNKASSWKASHAKGWQISVSDVAHQFTTFYVTFLQFTLIHSPI